MTKVLPVVAVKVKKIKSAVVEKEKEIVTKKKTTAVNVDVDVEDDADTDVVPESEISKKLTEYSTMLHINSAYVSRMKVVYRQLERLIAKQQKSNMKALIKKSKRLHKPSGFNKPSLISDEMASFIGHEKGTYISRIEAAKYLTNYIRDNNLKDPVNGRIIRADTKLSNLLQITEADDVHFFNLQKYMKHHFIKPTLNVA
jgi:chromatin remodeling complex protein RSC6